jgi:hypothetical protein
VPETLVLEPGDKKTVRQDETGKDMQEYRRASIPKVLYFYYRKIGIKIGNGVAGEQTGTRRLGYCSARDSAPIVPILLPKSLSRDFANVFLGLVRFNRW